jgi:hypothetical protein
VVGPVGSGATRSLILSYTKKSSVVVSYYPSLLETLKFSYATYLAFAIISYFVFATLYRSYVQAGLLDCQAYT